MRAFLCLRCHLGSRRSTCHLMGDAVPMTTIGWQDRGCQRMAMRLVDRAELDQAWMTPTRCCLAGAGRAEACCERRRRAARSEARWVQEDTAADCLRRRPASGAARDRRAAACGLGHSRAAAAAALMDGGGGGVARAMGASRRRCDLVRAASLVRTSPGRRLSHASPSGTGRDRARRDLRRGSASAAGRWACGMASGSWRSTRRSGGGSAEGARRGEEVAGGPWRVCWRARRALCTSRRRCGRPLGSA